MYIYPDRYCKMLLRLPIGFDWLKYKGDVYFGVPNYEATKKAGKPIIDLAYCATEGLHGSFMMTVQFDKKKFENVH